MNNSKSPLGAEQIAKLRAEREAYDRSVRESVRVAAYVRGYAEGVKSLGVHSNMLVDRAIYGNAHEELIERLIDDATRISNLPDKDFEGDAMDAFSDAVLDAIDALVAVIDKEAPQAIDDLVMAFAWGLLEMTDKGQFLTIFESVRARVQVGNEADARLRAVWPDPSDLGQGPGMVANVTKTEGDDALWRVLDTDRVREFYAHRLAARSVTASTGNADASASEASVMSVPDDDASASSFAVSEEEDPVGRLGVISLPRERDQRDRATGARPGRPRHANRGGAPQGTRNFGERSESKVYGATPSTARKEIVTLPKEHRGDDRMSGSRSPSGEPPEAPCGAASKTGHHTEHVERNEE